MTKLLNLTVVFKHNLLVDPLQKIPVSMVSEKVVLFFSDETFHTEKQVPFTNCSFL